MSLKIIYNKFLPPGGFAAINILGVVFARKDYGSLSLHEINHELIHTKQIYEMLVIPFYICYFLEWVVRSIMYLNLYKAYRNISFEREAYNNMYDELYLKKRRLFSFVKYYSK